ncbi:MAG: isopentenyl phosphate kinase [Candidatus Thalassarchaeaceae archaeon]|nr:isopentenyl phosphate kinase [Candidatus Thalassarchaeaceae archaeon]MDP6702997.1 isopentenyl phosphate kinase [Candidatus Thalassarchaeaceae archaeon]MDP7004225.1 isopentenyl phosphate kinase [Candidatus Thalassarchaeaceae archaeon]
MIIVKAGGSAITNKSEPYTPDEGTIASVAEQLSQATRANRGMILVHGVGSFGHPLAKEHDLGRGYDGTEEGLMGSLFTHYWVDELSQRLIKAMIDHGVPALRCRPTTSFVTKSRRIADFYSEPIEKFLEMGIVPVFHGDVPADRDQGFSVLSSDQIAVFLAMHFGAGKVIFGMDVPGLLRDGERVPELGFGEIPGFMEFVSDNHDASGGLQKKMQEIQALEGSGIEVQVIGLGEPGALLRAIEGETVGTIIR